MGRRNRGSVEHPMASGVKDLPGGVNDALEKVKEMNEADLQPEVGPIDVPSELKDLVLFGKVVEDVSVGGYTIKMSTLSNRQQKHLVKRLVMLDAEERLMNVKAFTLSQSIKSINGLPLEELYSDDEDLSVDDMKVEVISNLQSNLVEKLFDKYENLVKKSNSFFENGDLSDQVKN